MSPTIIYAVEKINIGNLKKDVRPYSCLFPCQKLRLGEEAKEEKEGKQEGEAPQIYYQRKVTLPQFMPSESDVFFNNDSWIPNTDKTKKCLCGWHEVFLGSHVRLYVLRYCDLLFPPTGHTVACFSTAFPGVCKTCRTKFSPKVYSRRRTPGTPSSFYRKQTPWLRLLPLSFLRQATVPAFFFFLQY